MKLDFTASGSVDYWQRSALIVILAVAALTRLPWLAELSLSNDELSAMVRARHDSFSELIRDGVHIDYHPAGVEIFIHYWVKLFGEGAFAFRLPFALLSIWSVYLVFLVGRRWFNAVIGLVVAAFFASFEHPLLYSILARMYSPGLFFCLLGAFHWSGWINSVRKGQDVSKRDLIGLSIAMLLGPHTHYFVIVQLFAMGMSGFLLIPFTKWMKYGLVCSLGSISFLTEWSVFKIQMSTGDLGGWLGRPGPDFLVIYFKEVFNGFIWLPAILFSAAVLFSFKALREPDIRIYFFCGLGWFLFSFSLGYGYSILRHPALQSSTLFFSLPFLLLAVAGLFPLEKLKTLRLFLLTLSFLAFGSFTTVFARDFYSNPPFGVFKEVSEDVEEWVEEVGRDSILVIANTVNPAYLDYYFSRSENPPVNVLFKVETYGDLARLRDAVDSLSSKLPYIAYVWTNSLHPYEINSIISSRYSFIRSHTTYFNAECWLYSRSEEDSIPVPEKSWTIEKDQLSGSKSAVVTDDVRIDSVTEYFSGVQDSIFSDDNFKIFTAKIAYRSYDTFGGQMLVFEASDAEGQLEWYGIRMNDYNLHPGEWQEVHLARPIPYGKGKVKVKCYVWNKDHRSFFVDKVSAKLESAHDPYSRK